MDKDYSEKSAFSAAYRKWKRSGFTAVTQRLINGPYGIEGVDTMAAYVFTTKRRFEQMIPVWSRYSPWDPKIFGRKDEYMDAVLMLPVMEFETALGLNSYQEDIKFVWSKFLHSQSDHPRDNVRGRIVVWFEGLLYEFFGTEEVWNYVNGWRLSCQGIKRKQEVAQVIERGIIRLPRFQPPTPTEAPTEPPASDDIDSDEGKHQQDTESGDNADVKYENRYRVAFEEVREIGKGSYGTVVEAKNITDKNAYAVKKILKLPEEDIPLTKMLHEVEVLAKLDHPNIVGYRQGWVEKATESDIKCYSWRTESSKSAKVGHDQAAHDGANRSPRGESSESTGPKKEGIPAMIYIQMQLCNGSLADKLKADSPDSWIQNREKLFGTDSWKGTVLEILKQLLQAVDYIHSKKVIHTDLKPGNILYDEERELFKLGDFGLATHFKQQLSSPSQWSREPASGHFVWANKYCSPYEAPEQVKGSLYDRTVDIYSLGVVLAELLCLFEDSEEGVEKLSKLRSHDIPAALDEYKTKENNVVDMVSQMCYTDARRRPTAKFLLDSGLVITTDLIIKNLKAEVEEKDRQIELLLGRLLYEQRKSGRTKIRGLEWQSCQYQ